MLPDTKDPWGAKIPRFGQAASDFGGIVPLFGDADHPPAAFRR